jgi:hypothetical protein
VQPVQKRIDDPAQHHWQPEVILAAGTLSVVAVQKLTHALADIDLRIATFAPTKLF